MISITKKKRILFIISGFLPEFEAGSEVFLLNLATSIMNLGNKYDISVFCRTERLVEGIQVSYYRNIQIYQIEEPETIKRFDISRDPIVEKKFLQVLFEFTPDLIHIHSLNHLSLTIVENVHKYKIPIVYTLHDYYLLCLQGQYIKLSSSPKDTIQICSKKNKKECVKCILTRFRDQNGCVFSENEAMQQFLTREGRVSCIFKLVNIFIAPSKYLRQKFIESGLSEKKILFHSYGFNYSLFDIQKIPSLQYRVGYIGRIIPTKGIHLLINAFKRIHNNNFQLKIFGFFNPHYSDFNENILTEIKKDIRISYQGRYNHKEIGNILSTIDVLVVPSLWYENSPLVIQEAIIGKVPVIGTAIGGIEELVKKYSCGLLFQLNNIEDLRKKIIDSYRLLMDDYYHFFKKHQKKPESIIQTAEFHLTIYQKLIKKFEMSIY